MAVLNQRLRSFASTKLQAQLVRSTKRMGCQRHVPIFNGHKISRNYPNCIKCSYIDIRECHNEGGTFVALTNLKKSIQTCSVAFQLKKCSQKLLQPTNHAIQHNNQNRINLLKLWAKDARHIELSFRNNQDLILLVCVLQLYPLLHKIYLMVYFHHQNLLPITNRICCRYDCEY